MPISERPQTAIQPVPLRAAQRPRPAPPAPCGPPPDASHVLTDSQSIAATIPAHTWQPRRLGRNADQSAPSAPPAVDLHRILTSESKTLRWMSQRTGAVSPTLRHSQGLYHSVAEIAQASVDGVEKSASDNAENDPSPTCFGCWHEGWLKQPSA